MANLILYVWVSIWTLSSKMDPTTTALFFFFFSFFNLFILFYGIFPLSRLFIGHDDGFVRSSGTQRTRARRGRKGVRCAIHARGPRKHEEWEDSAWRLSSDVRVRPNRHISWKERKKKNLEAWPSHCSSWFLGSPFSNTAFETKAGHLFLDLVRFYGR
jgi:hypothetical protein